MPYDAYTGDTIHQYFQVYQQMDCAIDAEHVTPRNPIGCLHDLQSAVTATYSTAPGGTPHDTGQTMAFFNMLKGDAPITKSWAERIPMIAVSPWSTGSHVSHVYNEHSSFVKFVERNWGLGKLTSRSRDNLPNPKHNWLIPMSRPTCRRSGTCSTCSTSTPSVTSMGTKTTTGNSARV